MRRDHFEFLFKILESLKNSRVIFKINKQHIKDVQKKYESHVEQQKQ